MKDTSDMIMTELPEEKLHLSFSEWLTLFLVFSGAVGGGYSCIRILEHFSVSYGICRLFGFLYWVLYCCLVVSRLRTKSDVQRLEDNAYNEGFQAGCDHEAPISYAAGEKRGYDRGYENGLLDGRSDGWDHGYESALKDRQEAQK